MFRRVHRWLGVCRAVTAPTPAAYTWPTARPVSTRNSKVWRAAEGGGRLTPWGRISKKMTVRTFVAGCETRLTLWSSPNGCRVARRGCSPAIGVPVVLLSATLPAQQRHEMLKSYQDGQRRAIEPSSEGTPHAEDQNSVRVRPRPLRRRWRRSPWSPWGQLIMRSTPTRSSPIPTVPTMFGLLPRSRRAARWGFASSCSMMATRLSSHLWRNVSAWEAMQVSYACHVYFSYTMGRIPNALRTALACGHRGGRKAKKESEFISSLITALLQSSPSTPQAPNSLSTPRTDQSTPASNALQVWRTPLACTRAPCWSRVPARCRCSWPCVRGRAAALRRARGA